MWVFTIIIVHGPLNSQPLAQRRLLVTLCKYTWTQRCRKLFSGCHVIRVPNPRQNVSRHLLPASPPMLGAVQLKRNTSTSCPRCTCPPLKFSATCLPLSRDKHALLSGSGCHCGDGERLPLPAVHASSPGTEAAAVRWGGRAGPGLQVRGGTSNTVWIKQRREDKVSAVSWVFKRAPLYYQLLNSFWLMINGKWKSCFSGDGVGLPRHYFTRTLGGLAMNLFFLAVAPLIMNQCLRMTCHHSLSVDFNYLI